MKRRLAFLILFSQIVCAETPNYTSRMENLTAVQAAKEALGIFSELVNNQNYKALGLDERGQISGANLGTPFRRFMVRLDELQSYESGKSPQTMLHDMQEILFPIVVNQLVVSSLTIGRSGDQWAATSFGGANFIRLVTDVRKKLAEMESQPLEAYIEVRIPALNLIFLGREAEGKLMLTPTRSVSRFGFEEGKPLNADFVFTKLQPYAREHKDLPS